MLHWLLLILTFNVFVVFILLQRTTYPSYFQAVHNARKEQFHSSAVKPKLLHRLDYKSIYIPQCFEISVENKRNYNSYKLQSVLSILFFLLSFISFFCLFFSFSKKSEYKKHERKCNRIELRISFSPSSFIIFCFYRNRFPRKKQV